MGVHYNTRQQVIDASILDVTDERSDRTVVRTGASGANIYIFYIDSTSDLVYIKSTDSGKTWGTAQIIEGVDAYISVSVWYDRWTIGDTTGNLIHMIGIDSTNTEATYFVLDSSTDTLGTNNNTVIDTANTAITPPNSGGSCSICKGKDGDIHCGYSAATVAGYHTFFSENAGATWAATNGGNDPKTDMTSNSHGVFVPLSTDNDILFVGIIGDNLFFYVWDAVGDTWARDRNVAQAVGINVARNQFAITQDKSTADCYIVFTNVEQTMKTSHVKFNESTRDLENHSYIDNFFNGSSSSDLIPIWEYAGIDICRNQDTGQMCIFANRGDAAVTAQPFVCCSSDDGKTWSNWFQVMGQLNNDDMLWVRSPMITTNAEGWFYAQYNDDLNDILARIEGLPVGGKITGVVKDNAGATVSGARVDGYLKGLFTNAGGRDPYIGSAVSDGSGNYTIHLPPKRTYLEAGSRFCFTRAHVNNGDIDDPPPFFIPDLSTDSWVIQIGTAVVIDTVNKRIDFDASLATGEQNSSIQTFEHMRCMPLTCDFDLVVSNFTQGSDVQDTKLIIMIQAGIDDVNSNAVSGAGILRLFVDNATNRFELVETNLANPSTSTVHQTLFTTPISATTFYVRIGWKDRNTLRCELYSDAARTTLIEAQDLTHTFYTSSHGDLDNFSIGTNETNTNHVLDGFIENIKFYLAYVPDVTTGDGGTDETVDATHTVAEV